MDEELVTIAMGIILKAGDAKNLCADALELAKTSDFEQCSGKLKEANDAIVEAHAMQTNIIQEEARGVEHKVNLLFIHAQDTLMVTMGELRLTKELVGLYQLIRSKE